MNPECRPRFALSEVEYWAKQYDYADDKEVVAAGDRARENYSYTRDDFLTVMRWKTRGRTQHLCEENSEADVRDATRRAMTTPDEREAMSALTALRGVAVPTASALLHFAHPRRYSILDRRALWSLGYEGRPPYSLDDWSAYVRCCRSLAKQASPLLGESVSLRMLDKALWKYAEVHQPPKEAHRPHGRRISPPRPSVPRVTNKSAEMRRLYAGGMSVSAAAKAVGATYSHAHGVRKRWLASQGGSR